MNLYKSRSFNELFNDTVAFFRRYGKHFLGLYFRLLGPFYLFFLVVYTWIFYRGFQNVEPLISSVPGTVILIAFYLVILLAALLHSVYVPAYFYFFKERGTDFDVKDIWRFFLQNLGRILLFSLVMIVIFVPFLAVALVMAVILLVTIVGIIIPFVILNLLFSLWFMEYLYERKGIGAAFREAWDLMFTRFWTYTGALTVTAWLGIIVIWGLQLLGQSFILMIFFNDPAFLSEEGYTPGLTVILLFLGLTLAILVFEIFFSLFNQTMIALVYFSAKEEKYHLSSFEALDQIGANE
ncbi:MAG: hypothetical protein GXO27_06375 [Chlorobi bacterium]|nr:hypothetical protein [Chlorobiota bacterium]